jgi:S-adenosylmethionine-dependent methyltransferase
MMPRIAAGAERFEDAYKYAAYLRTAGGRLRTDLAWTNLRSFLPANASACRALDIGAGTGTLAIRLAELGFEVALLDVSESMLKLARSESDSKRLAGSIAFHHGDAARLEDLFTPGSFHVVICHNLLEYVDDPAAVLRSVSSLLMNDGKSFASLLVRNRWGEVLKAAIKDHDPEQSAAVARAGTVLDALYGEPVRVFDADDFRKMAEEAGLEPLATRGVRVVSDYVDCENLTESAYARLLEIEQLLGAEPPLAGIARYNQVIARRRTDARRGG